MSTQRKRNRFLNASPSHGSGYEHKPKAKWGFTAAYRRAAKAARRLGWRQPAIWAKSFGMRTRRLWTNWSKHERRQPRECQFGRFEHGIML